MRNNLAQAVDLKRRPVKFFQLTATCRATMFLLVLLVASFKICANGLRLQENDLLSQLLQAVGKSGSQDLRNLVDAYTPQSERLPELFSALSTAKREIEANLRNEEAQLTKMVGADTPSMEIHSLMSKYVQIFNEQWMGEELPTRELTKRKIEQIQSKYFNMTAVDFAKAMVESWRKHGAAEFHDVGFDHRLIEVANMLTYDSANQLLTYSSHFWLHLTNMYMLLVRSIKDMLDPRDPSKRSNIGNVGRVGADDCNAAIIDAKHAFRKGASEKGLKFMQYGIKLILDKHVHAAEDIFMSLPSVKDYVSDVELMSEFRQALVAYVDESFHRFHSEYQKFLFMVTTNIQQPKIFKMLNTMSGETEERTNIGPQTKAVEIRHCKDVMGSETSNSVKFPMCKCSDYKATVFCGRKEILDEQGQGQRKFDVNLVMQRPACIHSAPYCSAVTQQDLLQDQLEDLAMLLDPKPGNCRTLYDQLVDSSIDILVNNVGSLMYYLAYDNPEGPIVKRDGFAMQLFEKIRGEGAVPEKILEAKFPSLGQKRVLSERIMRLKSDLSEFTNVISLFQKMYGAAQNESGHQ